MRKTVFLFLIMLSLAVSARRKQEPAVNFNPRQFEVSIRFMEPLRWSARSVGYGYSLALRNDTVAVHLPYMGVVHQADMENDGLNFERPIETFQTGKGRKGRTLVAFTCRRGIISYLFHLTVFPNGRVDIRLSPSNADSIGYDGELEEKP